MTPQDSPLTGFLGRWELTASSGGRELSRAPVTFGWLRASSLLVQRTEPQTFLVPEWVGAAPQWSEAVIGVDDHSGRFTMLYHDARGTSRHYRMTLDDGLWTLASRPGADFHQRFSGRVSDERITGQWQASTDGRVWRADFDVTYERR